MVSFSAGRTPPVASRTPGKSYYSGRKGQHAPKQKAALVERARGFLRASPDGMCGGLLTQRLRDSESCLIEAVYGETKEAQRGWLQDLMRSLPDVCCRNQGRDSWYSLIDFDHGPTDNSPVGRASSSNSSASSARLPFCGANSEGATSSPVRQHLASCIRELLSESDEGLSRSSLGLRLRRLYPEAIDELYREVEANAASPTSPSDAERDRRSSSLVDLVEALPDITICQRNGSVYYLLNGASRSDDGLLKNPIPQLNALASGITVRLRACCRGRAWRKAA